MHLVQNDAESWVPVAEWALELRRQGKAVLFVAHAGKSKQQRGTSKKEDVIDVVIKLDHSQDYQPEMGAAFTVAFEKARHLSGDDARNLEASLARDQQDTAPVRAIQAQAGRIGSAQSIATLASINEIIGSLTRATLCRNLKKALQAIPAGVPGGLGAIAAR